MRRQWIRSGLLGKWWSWRGAWVRVIVLPGLSVALRWPHGAAGHAGRPGACLVRPGKASRRWSHSLLATRRARDDIPSRYERIPQRKRQLRTYRCARRAPVGGADAALATVFCDL